MRYIFLIVTFFCIFVQAQEGTLVKPLDNNIYIGAFPDFGGSENIVSSQRIKNYETIIDKKVAWAMFSNNWYNGIRYPKEKIAAIVRAGTIPYIRLMPRSDEVQGHAEVTFSMQKIIDGRFDNALRKWAQDAKTDDIPLLVDFAVEPNGDWFQWSGKFTGGNRTDGYGDASYPDGPERYRDAYRHIIKLFRAEGVTNITWFFHYNYASFPNVEWNQPKYYYPGDAYIDWVGFSLYGAQTVDEEWDGLEFSTQLGEYFSSFQALHTTKPVALLEFGVTDYHADGDKSTWFDDAFQTILYNNYIKFSAISLWHENWQNEDGTWSTLRLDSSPKVKKTIRVWLKSSRFKIDLKWQQNKYSFLPALYGLLLE